MAFTFFMLPRSKQQISCFGLRVSCLLYYSNISSLMEELYIGFGTILGTLSKNSELSGLFTCKALGSESYK